MKRYIIPLFAVLLPVTLSGCLAEKEDFEFFMSNKIVPSDMTGKCQDDDTTCNGNDVYICQDGSWKKKETCNFGCNHGLCSGTFIKCSNDDTKCEGNTILICQDNQWLTKETCESSCNNGVCTGCKDDDTKCEGNTVYKCWDNHWWTQDTCESGCNNGSCMECKDGDAKCKEKDAYICQDGKWNKKETCEFTCSNGACSSGCDSGLTACKGVGCVDLSRDASNCNACGNACSEGEACKSGKCTDCATNNATKCEGNTLLICQDTGWENKQTCEFGCDNGTCLQSKCLEKSESLHECIKSVNNNYPHTEDPALLKEAREKWCKDSADIDTCVENYIAYYKATHSDKFQCEGNLIAYHDCMSKNYGIPGEMFNCESGTCQSCTNDGTHQCIGNYVYTCQNSEWIMPAPCGDEFRCKHAECSEPTIEIKLSGYYGPDSYCAKSKFNKYYGGEVACINNVVNIFVQYPMCFEKLYELYKCSSNPSIQFPHSEAPDFLELAHRVCPDPDDFDICVENYIHTYSYDSMYFQCEDKLTDYHACMAENYGIPGEV